MQDKIRVLIVDDSSVMRKIISDILAAEPDLELVQPAGSGTTALSRLDQAAVDVIVLDVEMPGMSGLDVLDELRQRRPMPIVIMFSASTQKAAATTLEALARGASDYVTKPGGTGNAAASVEQVRVQLLPKIRALGARRSGSGAVGFSGHTPSPVTQPTSTIHAPAGSVFNVPNAPGASMTARTPTSRFGEPSAWPSNAPVSVPGSAAPSSTFRVPAAPRSSTPPSPPSSIFPRTSSSSFPGSTRAPSTAFAPSTPPVSARPARPVEVLAIATSTGGPNALGQLLRELPSTFPVPIVIVQHMPPLFTKMLAERLTATTQIPVDEAVHGQALVPGRALLAPGDQHMTVSRQGTQLVVLLNKDPPEQSCRPAADVLFRSVAATFGGSVLAVVLTGMGQDGLAGAQILHAAGAQIIVQDEASSVVWGMPGFIARAGIADAIKPLQDLPHEILRRVRSTPTSGSRGSP